MVDFEWLDKIVIENYNIIKSDKEKCIANIENLYFSGFFGSYSLSDNEREYTSGLIFEFRKERKALQRQQIDENSKTFEQFYGRMKYYSTRLKIIAYLCSDFQELKSYKTRFFIYEKDVKKLQDRIQRHHKKRNNK